MQSASTVSTNPNSTAPATFANEASELLAQLSFKHPLRTYQREILDLVEEKVSAGEKEVHIVAPPGAGKTIIGLQIISQLKAPALILSPNTTIQSQWSQKLSLFSDYDASSLVGTHEDRPLKPITILTYQVLSTPGREQEYLEQLARKEWVNELRDGRALSIGEAELRILEILQNNPAAYKRELSRHASRLRRRLSDVLDINEVLHKNAIDLIQSLRRQGISTVIFDECHHLTDYWAAIMHHLLSMLDGSVVVALTGTPPEGKTQRQEDRYSSLVGKVDYSVPTPALVRESGLAPFQDLVYFVRPRPDELVFLRQHHAGFHELLDDLVGAEDARYSLHQLAEDPGAADHSRIKLPAIPVMSEVADQLTSHLMESRLNDCKSRTRYQVRDQNSNVSVLLTLIFSRLLELSRNGQWCEFESKQKALAGAMVRCMWKYKLPVPKDVKRSETVVMPPTLDDWMTILEDYASNTLKTSSMSSHHRLFGRIKSVARGLGYAISERGLRKQASPSDRILAFSNSKSHAVAEILAVEFRSLQESLRAIVVTDYEKMSATAASHTAGIQEVLPDDAGGAVSVLRALLASPLSPFINPCLVTGSLLLVDRRITEKFVNLATKLLRKQGFRIELSVAEEPDQPYSRVTSNSASWEPRLYVRIATEIFEQGITKCLIGTRGLFGEGWDSQDLNTLIDLTTATSPVTVKQLRGRSIRIKTGAPIRKVANNWDVVCIAPELEKGLNDYHRFVKKHNQFFSVSDDGQIEKGVGHVHPTFSELTPSDVFEESGVLNAKMMERAFDRERVYDLWKVDHPYHNRILSCLEISGFSSPGLIPPGLKLELSPSDHAGFLRLNLKHLILESVLAAIATGATLAMLASALSTPVWLLALLVATGFLAGMNLGRHRLSLLWSKYRKDMAKSLETPEYLRILSCTVLSGLKAIGRLDSNVRDEQVVISRRSNGSYRLYLSGVEKQEEKLFLKAMRELLAAPASQHLFIPRTGYRLDLDPCEGSGVAILDRFLWRYLQNGKVKLSHLGFFPVPSVFARSKKSSAAFLAAWNKRISPGQLEEADKNPEIISRSFGKGPRVIERSIWE